MVVRLVTPSITVKMKLSASSIPAARTVLLGHVGLYIKIRWNPTAGLSQLLTPKATEAQAATRFWLIFDGGDFKQRLGL
jgi:hypothetical protein